MLNVFEVLAIRLMARMPDKLVELIIACGGCGVLSNYNSRNWQFNNTAREKLFNICLELAFRLDEEN